MKSSMDWTGRKVSVSEQGENYFRSDEGKYVCLCVYIEREGEGTSEIMQVT